VVRISDEQRQRILAAELRAVAVILPRRIKRALLASDAINLMLPLEEARLTA
jgi:hypothetical protein